MAVAAAIVAPPARVACCVSKTTNSSSATAGLASRGSGCASAACGGDVRGEAGQHQGDGHAAGGAVAAAAQEGDHAPEAAAAATAPPGSFDWLAGNMRRQGARCKAAQALTCTQASESTRASAPAFLAPPPAAIGLPARPAIIMQRYKRSGVGAADMVPAPSAGTVCGVRCTQRDVNRCASAVAEAQADGGHASAECAQSCCHSAGGTELGGTQIPLKRRTRSNEEGKGGRPAKRGAAGPASSPAGHEQGPHKQVQHGPHLVYHKMCTQVAATLPVCPVDRKLCSLVEGGCWVVGPCARGRQRQGLRRSSTPQLPSKPALDGRCTAAAAPCAAACARAGAVQAPQCGFKDVRSTSSHEEWFI